MIIGVDFDGTIVEHKYPSIGGDVNFAIEVLAKLIENNHKIILFTMRSGDSLSEAEEYLNKKGINLFGVNVNPDQKTWTNSPKPYCNIYIDDAALGCPLKYPINGRPWVDWAKVDLMLNDRGLFRKI